MKKDNSSSSSSFEQALARTCEDYGGHRDAAAVISARKTEVSDLLSAGISWRRLAYLMGLPVTSCRRAVLADPELAGLKRAEGFAQEIALARSYAQLKEKGFPLHELQAWLAARSGYDTARAKNAMYREQARAAQQKALHEQVAAAVVSIIGEDPGDRALREIVSYDSEYTAQREAAEQALAEIILPDEE